MAVCPGFGLPRIRDDLREVFLLELGRQNVLADGLRLALDVF